MIVVDASVMVVALTSSTEQGNAARSALTADDVWIAPAHMPFEVIRTLRKAVVTHRLAEEAAVAAFAALAASELIYINANKGLLRAAWSMRHNVPAYDAAYLAVAAEYEATLLTFDGPLAKAAGQIAPFISVRMP
jgi:predicted nucleic acid-binding protein